MDGQIIANASRLLELDDGLKGTTSQLDSVIAEYDALLRDTRNQIADVLTVWRKRRDEALRKLLAAKRALARAEAAARNSKNGEVPSYYYRAVDMCQEDYDMVSSVCAKVESIYDDFERNASFYRRAVDSCRQDYVNILQKSSHILTRYAELVRRSASITSDTTRTKRSKITAAGATPVGQTSNINDKPGVPGQFYELPATKQTWTTNADGSMVFNAPTATGKKLDACQGKIAGFLGTCGLVSCVNVLRLAGYPASEAELINYASNTTGAGGRRKLCTTNSFPDNNGGTSAKGRQQILKHFGIKSELREANIYNIAKAVSEGRGVILSVNPGILKYGWSNYRGFHAITVTSVKKDRYGNVLGFYVCDSGSGGTDDSKFYAAVQIENALTGRPMNVTSIIR